MKKQKQFYIDVMFTNIYGSEKHFKKMCKFNNWKCRKLPKKPSLFGVDAPNTVYRIYGNYSMDEIVKGYRVFIDNLMQFR